MVRGKSLLLIATLSLSLLVSGCASSKENQKSNSESREESSLVKENNKLKKSINKSSSSKNNNNIKQNGSSVSANEGSKVSSKTQGQINRERGYDPNGNPLLPGQDHAAGSNPDGSPDAWVQGQINWAIQNGYLNPDGTNTPKGQAAEDEVMRNSQPGMP